MNVSELIDLAKAASGLSQLEMSRELQVKPARLSEWKSGERRPDPGELAYFAEKAGLDVLETVADVERSFDVRFTGIWERALGNLRAAAAAAAAAGVVTPGHSIYSTTRNRAASVVKL